MLPSEWRHRRVVHVAIALVEGFPAVLQVVGSIAAVAVGVVSALPFAWSLSKWASVAGLFLLALLCLVASPLLQWHRNRGRLKREADAQKKMARLEQTISDLQSANSARETGHDEDLAQLRQHLCTVATNLLEHLGLNNSQCRISVYQHEERHGVFIEAARVSPNPAWRASGRGRYPDDMGLIAQAWRTGDAYGQSNRTSPESWAKHQANRFGIPYEIAIAITMKSQAVLGVRVSYDGRDVGVLMAESMDKNAIEPEAVETIQGHSSFARLGAMLAVGPKLPPDPG